MINSISNMNNSFSNNVSHSSDLRLANSTNIKSIGTNLTGDDLIKSRLIQVDLIEAKLKNATLMMVNLIYTDSGKANLSGINLTNTKLNKADLNNAKLRLTKFLLTKLIKVKNFFSAKLDKTSLEVTELHRTNLSGANLNKANLTAGSYITSKSITKRSVLDLFSFERDVGRILKLNDRFSDATNKGFIRITGNNVHNAKLLAEALDKIGSTSTGIRLFNYINDFLSGNMPYIEISDTGEDHIMEDNTDYDASGKSVTLPRGARTLTFNLNAETFGTNSHIIIPYNRQVIFNCNMDKALEIFFLQQDPGTREGNLANVQI